MSKKILRVNSSLFGNNGSSTQIIDNLVKQLADKLGETNVVTRDFSKEPVPHLDGEWVSALMTPAAEKSAEQSAKTQVSDTYIAEVVEADYIVIAAPMYNFNVPSMLKAWFDHLARAGVTFKYTENGPVGLVDDKPVYVVTTRGGMHKGTDRDTEVQFIRTFLAFIGLTQVEFIYAEGLNMQAHKEQALENAKEQVSQLVEAV
ncbi:Flavodoxin-like fold subfamily protein [Catenovulum agarivorans DS-2]|uniref:FMN dependent NADH:quinone oxidoreductase n=1 Tax=Catenovulum agarivorans DS-2 TaxID=1328313 RepID=W7QAV0_9ALTE|nr:NAD(P)H-dependent oxidoreductase [Catenovulum agarivorans]EWH09964.1 Flavodoxin-like fold subfamily protein [Catenovulum agarivorans DS-2]